MLAALGLAATACTGEPSTPDSSATTVAEVDTTSTVLNAELPPETTTTTQAVETSTTRDPNLAPLPPELPPIEPFPSDLPPPPSIPAGLEELVAGHNRLDADRINLVFSPWGWEDNQRFRRVVEQYVNWDGHVQMVDGDGLLDPGGTDAALGLFSFDPFRSNRHLFNVWITEIEPPAPVLWLNATEPEPFDLPDMSIITLALDPESEFPGIGSRAGNQEVFASNVDAAPQRAGDDSVANVMVAVGSDYPPVKSIEMIHELGHALFGFADEYVGRVGNDEGSPRLDFFPSCPASRETAEAWWGETLGEYDPQIDIWAQEMAAGGATFAWDDIEYFRDLVRTDLIEGGCFGVEGSFRSAEDTLMGFNQWAMGLPNRQRAEDILALWTGEVLGPPPTIAR